MYQAIEVKFLGPTNFRGLRYKAVCAAGSITLSADYALSGEANARKAAEALCAKYGWTGDMYGELHGGVLANGNHVFVLD